MTSQPRLKDLGRWLSGGTPPRDDVAAWNGDVPWLSAKDIDRDVLRPPTTFITEQAARSRSRVVPADTILLIVRGMALAHGLPIVRTSFRAAFNQDLKALVPGAAYDPRFVQYSLRGNRVRLAAHIDRAAHGTARVVDSMFRERVWAPARREQAAIATFLDGACERIDQLNKQLSGSIVAMREEGIASARAAIGVDRYSWVQIRYIATTGTGHTPSRKRSQLWIPGECTIPWFTLADVHRIRNDDVDVVDSTAECISPAGVAQSSAVVHSAGSVLLSRTASVGFSTIMGVNMAVSQDFMTWTCGPRLMPTFLLHTLRALRPELRRLMHGSTHKTIYMPDLLELRIPLPSIDEQAAAVAGISKAREGYHALIASIARTRSRLTEYRDALITEAITGQLDVTRVSDAQMDERAHAAAEGDAAAVKSLVAAAE